MPSAIAALKAELQGEPPPPGWYTVAQLAQMLGIAKQTAESLVARKKWKCAQYTTITSDNRKLKAKHFLVT
jgi:hypothetical protein